MFAQGNHIFWRDPKDARLPDAKRGVRSIFIKDITGIEIGRNTKNFDRYKKPEKALLSFSVKSAKRDLDLEAPSIAEMELFLRRLEIVMVKCKRDSAGVVPKSVEPHVGAAEIASK